MSFRLMRGSVSPDVVEVLELMLENAKTGSITGIAVAATMRKSRYITTIAGNCLVNPTFARGMVLSLSDELGQVAKEMNAIETRF